MIVANREAIINNPEDIDEVVREARRTIEFATYCKHLITLRKYEDWSQFEWPFMCGWANKIDDVFVKLMISLSKNHYHYNAVSMHRWWRRLKAVNQHNIVSFFTFIGFPAPERKTKIDWTLLYQHCCKTSEIFAQMTEVYNDDKSVEMNLRALMGISQKKDIKEAWREWAKANHPDKGGSVDKFVLVKSAYEEWLYAVS